MWWACVRVSVFSFLLGSNRIAKQPLILSNEKEMKKKARIEISRCECVCVHVVVHLPEQKQQPQHQRQRRKKNTKVKKDFCVHYNMNIIFQVKHDVLFWFGDIPFQNSQTKTQLENNGEKCLAAHTHARILCYWNVEMSKKKNTNKNRSKSSWLCCLLEVVLSVFIPKKIEMH